MPEMVRLVNMIWLVYSDGFSIIIIIMWCLKVVHSMYISSIKCLGKEGVITEFLGKSCSLNSDVESIKKVCKLLMIIVDFVCQISF